MGRVKLHLVRYMGTYTILMFVSFLLWQAARMPRGSFKRRGFCLGGSFAAGAAGNPWPFASDFLIEFSLVAYPLYCAVKGFCKRLSSRNGGLHKAHGTLYRDAPSVSIH